MDRVRQSKAEGHIKAHGECNERSDEKGKVSREPFPSLRSGNQNDQECVKTLDPDDTTSLQDKTLHPTTGANANVYVDVAASAEGANSPQDLTCPFCQCIYAKASALIYHLELGFCYDSPAVNGTNLRIIMHQRDIHGIITNALVEKRQEKLYRCPNQHCRNEFMNLFALFSHLENECCSFMGIEKAKLFLCKVIQATRTILVE